MKVHFSCSFIYCNKYINEELHLIFKEVIFHRYTTFKNRRIFSFQINHFVQKVNDLVKQQCNLVKNFFICYTIEQELCSSSFCKSTNLQRYEKVSIFLETDRGPNIKLWYWHFCAIPQLP